MPRSPLWSITAYTRIWTARSVSELGTAVSELALPLLAAGSLGASNAQVGFLLAAGNIPLIILGLFIGVWTDRRRRLPLMVAADVARVVLLLLIPIFWWRGTLTYPILLGIVIGVGTCSVLFDVASQALVNSLLPRHLLVIGNARIQTSYAVASTIGPGLAGVLIRSASVPIAFAVDAVTFVVSAIALVGTRIEERHVLDRSTTRSRTFLSIIDDIRVGLRFVLQSDVLRTLTFGVAVWNFFGSMGRAMIVLYLFRTLGFSGLTIGLLTAVGGLGGLLGTIIPDWGIGRFGLGRAIMVMLLLSVPAALLLASASGPHWLAVGVATVAFVIESMANAAADISQFSLRNAATPDHLRGRVASAARVLLRSTVPAGSTIGGLLADLVGLRLVMAIACLGAPIFAVMIARSSVIHMRTLPDEHPETMAPGAPVPETTAS